MQVFDTVHGWRRATSAPLYRWREESSVVTKVSAAFVLALLMALAAQVRIVLPFTPVPFTGQVLVVLLGALVLGRYGALGQGMYLVMGGAFGWFSGMAGFVALLGPTGGYLLGFVMASMVIGEMVERRKDWNMRWVLAAMSLGVLIIYSFGAAQLALFMGLDIVEALVLGVVPFVTVDALKVLMAAGAGSMFLRPA
ncbi:MAG TPA: biotin transporter BioY [Methanomassiliicoccales archaeon]|nr:biotin transporter BioY [Methanomassiliicoccales archaeon]